MPALINVGGSLTGAVILIGLGYGIRALRAAHQRRKPHHRSRQNSNAQFLTSPLHAELTLGAVQQLLATPSLAHCVIDVRSGAGVDAPPPLPAALAGAVRIPGEALRDALTHAAAWRDLCPHGPAAPPTPSHLLVFVAEEAEAMQAAAAVAASLGFARTAALSRGLADATAAAAAAAAAAPPLPTVRREALALLLGVAAAPTTALPQPPRCVVVDVRRHDERALYGGIPGTVHLPAEQLPSALALPSDAFRAAYQFEAPSPGEVLAVVSRGTARARWAAQAARDAGWGRVVVVEGGTSAWRYDPGVKAYEAYQQWEPPPEPQPFVAEQPDIGAGLAQLAMLEAQLGGWAEAPADEGSLPGTPSHAHPSNHPTP